MSANPGTNVRRGWLARLLQTALNVATAVAEAGSNLVRTLWSHGRRAFIAARRAAVAHPNFTAFLVILILAVLLAYPVARLIVEGIGFSFPGVRAGSIATTIQSVFYGGFVPRGSIFSFLQSFGASAF